MADCQRCSRPRRIQSRLARVQLAGIARRRLQRLWKANALIPGATIVLAANVERQVKAYLKDEHGLDVDAVVGQTDKPLTPRALDRCLWAGLFGARRYK